MPVRLSISFAALTAVPKGVVLVLADDTRAIGPLARKLVEPAADLLARAMDVDRFKGKLGTALDLLAPAHLDVPRLVVLGLGKASELKPRDMLRLGGIAASRIPDGAGEATLVVDLPEGTIEPRAIADLALGACLRSYKFERYKTRKGKAEGEGEEEHGPVALTLLVPDPDQAARAWSSAEAVAQGVVLARDLVNEPPNVLDPPEFARQTEALRTVGVTVEVLDGVALEALGMRALLGVGQGSAKDSRVVVMHWNGGAADEAPLAFIGKGVTFDSGGISIKPAAGMEDMKGDMAGAACVTGLMHALAARKAKVNAVGVIGLVENMPDGAAQRPGDIVTSLSGQTIEIINTDAEGRLVLADVLWYVKDRFKPRFMIDLATLTGAILVALGQEHAGLFCNDDELAARLSAAGVTTGESVWRMPLDPAYDKLIDSKFADMKNSGGRYAGSTSAAKFLQRFVDQTAWAHLDIAGTGMGVPTSDINTSWGPGWGVRLLNQLVADHYEG